jgi:hypothetical protein
MLANPITNFHSESTALIQIVAKPIKTIRAVRVRLVPNLSSDLPTTIMNNAALREAMAYIDENRVLDHPISVIIGSMKMDTT